MEWHALSTGAGLDNMMKEPPKDETLFRYCQPNNPEENTIEQVSQQPEPEDKGMDIGTISPGEIRKKLFEERRKNFARRWFTKYNYFQKLREQKEIANRGRASSGIGEERIVQMEMAKSMAMRARKRGRKPKGQESVLGLPQEFKFNVGGGGEGCRKRGRPAKNGWGGKGSMKEAQENIPGVD